MKNKKIVNQNQQSFDQVVLLIEQAQNRAFQKVNEELVTLYFTVGEIVSQKVSQGVWGGHTVDELSEYINSRYPSLSGFNRRGLYRMKQFFEIYSSDEFLTALLTQLQSYFSSKTENVSAVPTLLQKKTNDKVTVSAVPTQLEFDDLKHKFIAKILTKITWTNHLEIMSQTKSPEEKFFYMMLCIKEKWTMRELRRQLSSGIYERTMLGNVKLPETNTKIQYNQFREPYIFEFLDLPDGHSEKDLEKSLVLNLRKFILEIGKGFTYMGNQYRLQVGNKDYYTDLLFYHRDLQCLVLFELKINEFEPEYLGKLNFYLEALDRDVKRLHENPSVGILLCKGKDSEVVEYAMSRNVSPAIIADYETKLIDKNLLSQKLHQLTEQLAKEIENDG